MGFALVVVTNQSGIARGKFTEAQFETLTEWMDWSLADRDVDLDGIYYCRIIRRVVLKSFARSAIAANHIRGCFCQHAIICILIWPLLIWWAIN